jgi:hypothetical protein
MTTKTMKERQLTFYKVVALPASTLISESYILVIKAKYINSLRPPEMRDQMKAALD